MPISNAERATPDRVDTGARFRVPVFLALVVVSFGVFAGSASGDADAAGTAGRASVGAAVPVALDCTQGSLSKDEAIDQLHTVRESIDRSLRLLDAGRRAAAFAEAKTGYLQCFEAVEAPLDVTAGIDFRFEVEDAFARVRGLIESGAPSDEVRDRIVTLRGLIDDTERKLTAEGIGAPLIVFTQSFTVLLREGLEAVLLLSVLLAYLDSTKSGSQYRKPILLGVGIAIVATVATYFLVDAIFSVLPFGREVLEAVVGLIAVATLFYLSFWLLARLEQRRWLEFLKARIWTAVTAGSVTSLALIGFTSVYREGFETVLFYQAIFSFSQGLEVWVWLGVLAALIVLAGVAYAVLKLGRTIPMRTFLSFAIVIVMLTSVAVLGNAMRALQESTVISLHFLEGWPILPIFLAQATGYYPTLPSVLAQGILLTIYALGAVYMFLIRPRRRASRARAGNGSRNRSRAPPPSRAEMAGGVRVGVDVGGTFTKAVAVDLATGEIVARSVVATTHDDAAGPAGGVVHVVGDVARQVGPERVDLVTHSTTQAVNALLEGDTGVVGVLGLGRQPDVNKARRRTRLDKVDLSPGRRLPVVSEFLDVTAGLDDRELEAALDRLVAGGATAICVAEAFAPDGGDDERHAVVAALARGLPACGSSEMTGLYGLELRTVTAALNASILPIAVGTAQFVERGVAEAGVRSPVMVMRGDGGAIDADGFRREPARTLYSGPAASVAGVLRFSRVTDGVVVEVGGTSTNVAAIKDGKPALSYVQVASHATALRSLDVRVVGVAGGSMLRARRNKLYGVGPRSAHIARLPYTCYLDATEIDGAEVELLAPRPGDPEEYVVLRLRDGRRAALTNTCAAVALGVVQPGDYAAVDAHAEAARAGFALAGKRLKLDGTEVARRMLAASAQTVGDLINAVAEEYELRAPTLVAVGGGAGGVGRFVAATLGLECQVPAGAEVISSIGDALSLVRIECERSIVSPRAEDSAALAAEAEEACVAAGASPASVDVRVEFETERSTLRAIATGAVGLEAGALPGRKPILLPEATTVSVERGLDAPVAVGSFWVAARPDDGDGGPVLVLDRFGDPVSEGWGAVVDLSDPDAGARVAQLVERFTRQVGPLSMPPTVWLLDASRLIGLAPADAGAACRKHAGRAEPAAAVVLRS